MRRTTAAVLAAMALSLSGVAPVRADHGQDIYRWTNRQVILEDRTGIAQMRDAGANAAARWTAAGAAITVTYRNGPVTNTCGFEGYVVSMCTAVLDRSDDAYGQTPLQLSGPYGNKTITGAFIQIQPWAADGSVGNINIRGIIAHEVGHDLCCYQHSAEASIMNALWAQTRCGYECEGPLQHDIDLLRSIYGVAGAVRVQGQTWFDDMTTADKTFPAASNPSLGVLGSGAVNGRSYYLVSGRDTGGGPCSSERVVMSGPKTANTAGYFGSGYVPRMIAPLGRPPGRWQICMWEANGTTVTAPVSVTLT